MVDSYYHNSLIKRTEYHFNENLKKIEFCLEQLSETDFWNSPDKEISCVGNQLLHLEGNMRQWILHGILNEKDQRDRRWEFEVSGLPKMVVFEKLKQTVKEIITRLKEHNMSLSDKTDVQGYVFDGIGKLIHVVEHFSYHTAQVVLLTKLLTKADLDFYPDVN